jgi:pullulanase
MPTETCTQENLYGHGIGTFNDRIRDCVRGGGHSADNKTEQGFATGLWYDDNAVFDGEQRRNLLLHYGDVIKVSLAGNLRDFSFTDYAGHLIKGEELKFKGMPAGYAAEPWETINFVSAHDNYDLWDQVAAKAPFQKPERKPNTATPNERARMHCMALSIIALGQGIPFFHAGSDFLRSKSGDNNSYNSGDWFNRIDFSFKDNNWGVGLPPGENTREWDFWAPRLRDPYLKTSPTDIRETAEYFQALLKVRSSSPLFRLPNRNEIMRRLTFLETALGAQQPPGVIAMFIKDDFDNETPIDKTHRSVLAAFNVTFQPQEVTHELLKNRLMRPHSDLTDTAEPRVRHAKFRPDTGTITIPPQTLIVWVEPRLSLRKTGQPRT